MKPNLLMAIILPLFPALFLIYHSSAIVNNGAPTNRLLMSSENPYPIINAIPVPTGYKRIDAKKNSFGEWLRNLSLKKNKTVYLYDGSVKKDQSAQYAVLNISVGDKDLQQCADAVMRLRAEFLYEQKRFEEIKFTDNNGTNYLFSSPTDRPHFNKYLERVFSYCGTLSLERQLHPVKNAEDIQIGDVLIQGGSPGHAMLVVDMAMNTDNKKVYMLAQGYMPAQDIHIVVNPVKPGNQPWYELNSKSVITPGWIFIKGNFKRW